MACRDKENMAMVKKSSCSLQGFIKFLLFSNCVLSCHLIKTVWWRKAGCHFSELSFVPLQEQRDRVKVEVLFHSWTEEFYNENVFLDCFKYCLPIHITKSTLFTQRSNQPKNILLLSLQIAELVPWQWGLCVWPMYCKHLVSLYINKFTQNSFKILSFA